MIDLYVSVVRGLFLAFMVLCSACGVAGLLWALLRLLDVLAGQFLAIAALIEAAHEARKQGRTVWLERWTKWRGR